MNRSTLAAVVVTITVATSLSVLSSEQRSSNTTPSSAPPVINRALRQRNWPLHNLDLSSSRYSASSEITTSNVSQLALRWSFETPPAAIGEITPVVVDGVMYFNAGSKLYAVNAVTGTPVWTFEASPAFPPAHWGRGPVYGDGRIYAYGETMLYAVDAKTGKIVESFGEHGQLSVVNRILRAKYPGKYAKDVDALDLGYGLTNPPIYHNGMLYVAMGQSDRVIAGGFLAAIDGATGAVKWAFNTIPQGASDEGWEIAKDTWGTGRRLGGGVWTPPAIDPDLGMIYFSATNPAITFDGSARPGINLFTDSTIALSLATGQLKWHFQAVHHDIWDWDFVNNPVLFDVTINGRTVKGIGAAGKTCFVYMWNRETGKPLNPIVEMPVPTTTDLPGEKPWPTQPIPFTSRGVPQTPFCAIYPRIEDPELAKRAKPPFHPFQMNEFVIVSPSTGGGANYGSPSFSPRTGLMYITGKNTASSQKIVPIVESSATPERDKAGVPLVFAKNVGTAGPTGVSTSGTLAAYDPTTSQQVWYVEMAMAAGGSVVTAGDVLFQGTSRGEFLAFDARSGKPLYKYAGTPKDAIRASPLSYEVNGKQYVSVLASNTVLTFALP
jgi:glucose dehydrogenase